MTAPAIESGPAGIKAHVSLAKHMANTRDELDCGEFTCPAEVDQWYRAAVAGVRQAVETAGGREEVAYMCDLVRLLGAARHDMYMVMTGAAPSLPPYGYSHIIGDAVRTPDLERK